MAQLTIPNEDLIATLQAQRNEAWDAAARAGAACAEALRQIEQLENELVLAKKQIEEMRTPEEAFEAGFLETRCPTPMRGADLIDEDADA